VDWTAARRGDVAEASRAAAEVGDGRRQVLAVEVGHARGVK